MTATRPRTAVVCGAGGFIGSHLVKRLKREGFFVRGVDLKRPEFGVSAADEFVVGDLRTPSVAHDVFNGSPDHVYQLAADMGGAAFVFTGDHDAEIMRNSVTINLNVLEACRERRVGRVFYSSSACVYPARNQLDPENPNCREDSAYPADPDSEYGWEKLFSERLYFSYQRNYGLKVRIARLHNVFGEEGTWRGGREKAPAAICRKVCEASEGGTIEIWGDGQQTRSFLYVSDCIEGIRRLTDSEFTGPVNIGSEEMVTIDQLAQLTMDVAGKRLAVHHAPGPLGVRGRNSDNRLVEQKLNWKPDVTLRVGLEKTYRWIAEQARS